MLSLVLWLIVIQITCMTAEIIFRLSLHLASTLLHIVAEKTYAKYSMLVQNIAGLGIISFHTIKVKLIVTKSSTKFSFVLLRNACRVSVRW